MFSNSNPVRYEFSFLDEEGEKIGSLTVEVTQEYVSNP